MGVVVIVATILGGIAALWFFADKLWPPRGAKPPAAPIPLHDALELERTILESDAKENWRSQPQQSKSARIFKRDVNLRFEISHDDDGTQCEDFKEEWANHFPDPHATGLFCDLYYGASMIERFVLVSVDGGRALLPLPKSSVDLQVPLLTYKVAQIHDTLGSLDGYMFRSGLKVEAES